MASVDKESTRNGEKFVGGGRGGVKTNGGGKFSMGKKVGRGLAMKDL